MNFNGSVENHYLVHPTSQELTNYCKKWFHTPEAVKDEELIRFERHFLECKACVSLSHDCEQMMREEQLALFPKTMIVGSR